MFCVCTILCVFMRKKSTKVQPPPPLTDLWIRPWFASSSPSRHSLTTVRLVLAVWAIVFSVTKICNVNTETVWTVAVLGRGAAIYGHDNLPELNIIYQPAISRIMRKYHQPTITKENKSQTKFFMIENFTISIIVCIWNQLYEYNILQPTVLPSAV